MTMNDRAEWDVFDMLLLLFILFTLQGISKSLTQIAEKMP